MPDARYPLEVVFELVDLGAGVAADAVALIAARGYARERDLAAALTTLRADGAY